MHHLSDVGSQGRLHMRQAVLAAVAAFMAGGIATGAALSQAQPVPPPGEHGAGEHGAGEHGPDGHMMGGAGQRPWMAWRHHGGRERPFDPRAFALIYRQADRQLGAADVQKIAEGFLLWNGNHSWKVTDVAATADGPIAFSFTTPEGSVVAKFTMDPHTGRIARAG